jgi:protein-S-isoprenylcysteine O-methyltransferase Ste14
MLLRLIVQTLLWIALMGALQLVPAGTLDWLAAWGYLVEMGVLGICIGLWLARHDPGLLAERMSFFVQRGQKTWDRVFVAVFLPLFCAWLVLMGLDVRLGISRVPIWAEAAGALSVALCMYVALLAFRENSYAAPVIKIQSERGHTVVTTGPYRYVRHPLYAGALLYFLGTPLQLGSWLGLAPVPLMIAALAFRAVMEERMLATELEGYADYAARVRWRLIPGVW